MAEAKTTNASIGFLPCPRPSGMPWVTWWHTRPTRAGREPRDWGELCIDTRPSDGNVLLSEPRGFREGRITMPSIKMTQLSTELKRLGLENRLEMTGGNCGTITIGQPDADGFYWGIGPGNYYLDYITPEDMCWGKDTGERTDELFYYTGTPEDFTVANVAQLIVKSYRTTTCNMCKKLGA